jgi:4-hydroxybenzoate polyprenyltransferase
MTTTDAPSNPIPPPPQERPASWLVVDLDGTLLRTDLLYESLVVLLRVAPWRVFELPGWLLGGKARFKRRLSEVAQPDMAVLPVNEELLSHLRAQKAAGRSLALVSASDELLVRQVAEERFGDLFDALAGSDGTVNLTGEAKLTLVRERFGDTVTYAGDSRHDLAVWKGCGSAILTGRKIRRLSGLLPQTVTVEAEFPVPAASPEIWVRALRLHQWIKNGLICVAPLMSGLLFSSAGLTTTLLAFIVFGLLASATYTLNDLLDLNADRRHRTKKRRPFASGQLSIRDGLLAVPILGAATLALLPALPLKFAGAAGLYLVITLAYSLRLKREPILDMLVLAGLFTVRILAGILAMGANLTPWLLTFSMFFFLSLASIKRFTECQAMAEEGRTTVPGRGYRDGDAPWLMAMGAATGSCSILVFFIYLVDAASPIHQYSSPEWLWFDCIVLGYWLGRTWLMASRGEMNDDPVLFAVRDGLSRILGVFIVLTLVLARI